MGLKMINFLILIASFAFIGLLFYVMIQFFKGHAVDDDFDDMAW